MIELIHVVKRFGAHLAVDDLSLSVGPGEIFGLLGHNGAGKSTAIGMMLGQVWPTGGQVRVCGEDVTRERGRALRQVGAIFESPAFYDYLSGFRNLEILSSYTAPTCRKRILEVLDWVGLSGREGSAVRTYSHGMRSRLALAQALLPGPSLLILDEPSDGLDPEGIHEMRETVRRLHGELGLTILLSSHLLAEVEQLCTRVGVLSRGRKVFDGMLSEARQRQAWVRMTVDRFEEAAGCLKAAGLIVESRDGNRIALAPEAETDRIVSVLVSRGFRLKEIVHEVQTLEAFYLSLVARDSKPQTETAKGGGR